MKINPIDQTAPENKPTGQDADQLRQIQELDDLLKTDFTPPDPATDKAVQDNAANDMPDMETSVMCKMLLAALFGIMAGRRGKHWELQDAEAEQLGIALAAVLDKYMPEFKGGPEATLILVALLIVGPRAMQDMQNREKLAEEKKEKAGKAKTETIKDKPADKQSDQPAVDTGDLWIKDAA